MATPGDTGFLYGSSASGNTGGGATVWSNPTDALGAPNGVYAKANPVSGSFSGTRRLLVMNFADMTAIPDNATILGIEVSITRYGISPPTVRDNVVQLVKAAILVGDNKALTTAWPTADAAQIYGGPADLWGTTWSKSDLTHANFGVALAVRPVTTDGGQAWVDSISMKVYYETPAGSFFTQILG
jgi:hypothetical protein